MPQTTNDEAFSKNILCNIELNEYNNTLIV